MINVIFNSHFAHKGQFMIQTFEQKSMNKQQVYASALDSSQVLEWSDTRKGGVRVGKVGAGTSNVYVLSVK